jgi:fructose-bisphosphate aldolase, class II
MVRRVEDFAYHLMVNVFNASDTAPLAVQTILASANCDPGPKAARIEDPAQWIPEKIIRRARSIQSTKGPAGNFDD